MAIDANFYTKKKSTAFILSVGFLLLVVAGTAALYGYNFYLAGQNQQRQDTIAYYDNGINELKSDTQIQVYDLVKENKPTLLKLAERSNMKTHIMYLKQLSSAYQINFEGFVYNDGLISTRGKIATTENGDRAYAKLVNFLTKYRQDTASKFDILFVNSIAGHDNMEVDFKFKLK